MANYPGNTMGRGGHPSASGGGTYGNRSGAARSGGPSNAARQGAAAQATHVPLDSRKYVDTAQRVIYNLKTNGGRGNALLSTSKIRNLLSMISSLYDEVRRKRLDKLNAEEMAQIQYIRLHFAYEAGRDSKVKEFVTAADIFAHIRDIGDDKGKFLLFCRYMEALVAFHRFYGGKE